MLNNILLALIVIPFTAYTVCSLIAAIFPLIFHFIVFPILVGAKLHFRIIWILVSSAYEEYVKDHKLSFITGCGLGLVFTSQWF